MGLFKKKQEFTPMKQLMALHGKRLSYVVERESGEEKVVGKVGGISVTDEEIVIVCNGAEVFRGSTKGCVAATLMSGNGVDIKADSEGKRRHLICYYSSLK